MNTEFNTLGAYLQYTLQEITPPKLLDFDANLFHKDVNFETATQRAMENGVHFFVIPGSTLTDSAQAIEASRLYPSVVAATAGVHPYNTESIVLNHENVQCLKILISSQYCLAVGECGLDFSDGFPPSSFQINWFR
jgi:TatD DNase family protein